jgi:acyl-CoA thioesterase I
MQLRSSLAALVLAGGASLGNTEPLVSAQKADAAPKPEDGAIVLFQGDSITDGFRNNTNRFCDPALGAGYVRMIANLLPALYPDRKITVINRGKSGDKVKDLKARWQKDCLDLKPTWVSVMIGVNDCYSYNGTNEIRKVQATSVEEYESVYREILTQARQTLNPRFVLMEPYLVAGYDARSPALREDLDKRIAVVHRLAKEFDAVLVQTDRIMNEAEKIRGEKGVWTLGDGCHPKDPGCALMAVAWLRAVGALPPY